MNTYSPYILTALISRPKRLVYVSSGLHFGGNTDLKDLEWRERGDSRWSDGQAYNDSKLHAILLSNAAARLFPDVQSNSLTPGWVATKMGGSSAPDDIEAAIKTYLLLATGGTDGTGKYFSSSKEESPKKEALDVGLQNKLLELCEEATGIPLPKF